MNVARLITFYEIVEDVQIFFRPHAERGNEEMTYLHAFLMTFAAPQPIKTIIESITQFHSSPYEVTG